jgi:pimeloyl-ACP methyl ester carboxylesterase
MDALDKIVFWRRFIELENKNRSSSVRNMYRFELHEINEEGQIKKHAPGNVRIYATSQQMSNRLPSFRPVVHLSNIQQPLYFYLFFVAFDYSVSCPGGEMVYRPPEFEDKSKVEIPLWKKTLGWGPAKENVEDTCFFKLLVTTEPLDYQQFLQSGLTAQRDILGEPTPERVFDDWDAVMVAVTMVRQDNAINANNDVSLADGNIKIKAHPSISASVSIGVAESNTRGTGAINAFSRLNHHDQLAMVDFSPSRSVQTQNVIEIDNIQLSDANALEQQPLEITLKQTFADDELMLPIAFDGHHFRIIGDVDSDENGTQVRINEIPDVDMSNDPGTGERGFFKSLRMTFCKVALGHVEENKLQWVEFLPDGTIALQRENLGLKIGKAKKRLLVLHGLAGTGMSMMHSLKENLPASNLEQYDLILTYDYESLNTPLDVTAGSLSKLLREYGFGADDRKLTIISHSLGGLIARWVIEQMGGKTFIDHCILIGTPNNGSLFGKIDAYRRWAQTACELAINFIPSIVPFSGIMLKFFKTAADLGGSIAQIDPNSDFINKLNATKDPGIRYTVISGDASTVDPEGSAYQGYLEKAKAQLGKWVNHNEPNDLFAPVRSLQCKELWEDRNPENKIMDPVASHHFGYFMSMSGTRDGNTLWKVLHEVL